VEKHIYTWAKNEKQCSTFPKGRNGRSDEKSFSKTAVGTAVGDGGKMEDKGRMVAPETAETVEHW